MKEKAQTFVPGWVSVRGDGVQSPCHPPYLPVIVLVDFFLVRRVKLEPVGLSLSQESLEMSLEGIVRILAREKLAATI
jgi:hypothetical protein